MSNGLYTSSHDWQNSYVAHLSGDIGNSVLTIPLDTIPIGTEGCLVIDPDTPANTEIIFYTSKTGSAVVCPSNGRGYDSSNASAHSSGTKVIMAPIADDFRYIRTVATTSVQGYKPVGYTPNTVTYNGNRSYDLVFNGVDLTSFLSNGMRLQTTRTVTAPTQCTSLNGTTQYYSKTAPAGFSFTNNFTCFGWIKVAAYGVGTVIRKGDASNGFCLRLNASGQLDIFGGNVGSFDEWVSYQSVPLNKWVHVAATLDCSGNAATMYIDGVSVPCSQTSNAITAIVNSGNLAVGASPTSAEFFNGKLGQVGVASVILTATQVKAIYSQGLTTADTATYSIISAYSFNNSINDLNTTNANNLTANGSAVATNADSFCTQDDTGTPSGTTDFAIVTKKVFSTNSTITVQVPEGCTIPTSGGVSAVSYSSVKVPYGFISQRGKWSVDYLTKSGGTQATPTQNQWYNVGSAQITVPTGSWRATYQLTGTSQRAANGFLSYFATLSTSSSSETDPSMTASYYVNNLADMGMELVRDGYVDVSAATVYYLNGKTDLASITNIILQGTAIARLEPSYL